MVDKHPSNMVFQVGGQECPAECCLRLVFLSSRCTSELGKGACRKRMVGSGFGLIMWEFLKVGSSYGIFWKFPTSLIVARVQMDCDNLFNFGL